MTDSGKRYSQLCTEELHRSVQRASAPMDEAVSVPGKTPLAGTMTDPRHDVACNMRGPNNKSKRCPRDRQRTHPFAWASKECRPSALLHWNRLVDEAVHVAWSHQNHVPDTCLRLRNLPSAHRSTVSDIQETSKNEGLWLRSDDFLGAHVPRVELLSYGCAAKSADPSERVARSLCTGGLSSRALRFEP